MSNSITGSGLTIASQAELVTQYTTALQTIYGAGINLGPETPDGQWMMTMIQSVLDVEDLLLQIYNGFDPDNAIGVVLDQRCAINGIQRIGGTETVTPVSIYTSQSVNLYGLNQSAQPVYTVADAAGNQYQLQTTYVGVPVGSNSLLFQAAVPGAITPVQNTITVPVSIVLGVTSINNPDAYVTLGTNQETDGQLRLRRQKSVTLASQGYLAGLLAALENIPGVSYAQVYENNTGTTILTGPLTGLPGHSIWVVVAGSGSPSAIGSAIYAKRNAGCGMFQSGHPGATSYTVHQVNGTDFTLYWDDVVTVPLYTRFTVSSLDGTTPPNISAMLDPSTGLPMTFRPGVYQQVNANEIATLTQQIDPNAFVTDAGFSLNLGSPYTPTLLPMTGNQQFSVSGSNIVIIPMYITSPDALLTVDASDAVISRLSILRNGSQTMTSYGGYGTKTWSLQTNVSGATIGSLSGVYVAGSTTGVDVIKVHDAFPASQGGSYTAICTVTVS